MTQKRSPDDSEHVTECGGVRAIPGCVSDRNLPTRMQRLTKERHEAAEAKEQGSRALTSEI
jgi:hypothetical protein